VWCRCQDISWFRHHLSGAELELPADKPVEIFYMGANVWQFEMDWPIPVRYMLSPARPFHAEHILHISNENAEYND
jgi:hypothetical protein